MSKKKLIKKVVTTEIIEEEVLANTKIVCILDRSGSMGSIIDESINSFNHFLEEQKKIDVDEATLTVALFDDQYELLYDDVSLKSVEKITKDEWMPRGLTALYDAIGKTINKVREKVNDEDKVIVCIVTDGLENASQKYNNNQIKSLIKELENKGWGFVYLAANQDAMAVGGSFGIHAGNTYTYTADVTGVQNMSATLTNTVSNYRMSTTVNGDNLIKTVDNANAKSESKDNNADVSSKTKNKE